jgi:hypothetical protein
MPRNTTLFKLGGTKFFRAAASQLPSGHGTNLQNISKSMRAIYVPDGYRPIFDDLKAIQYLKDRDLTKFTTEERQRIKIMCQVDQAGAEALIVAYYCRPGKFRDLFLNKVKPHVFIALHNFCNDFKAKSPELSDVIDKALITIIPALQKLDGWKQLDTLIKSSDNWPAAERYYFIAKMICHALNYGMKHPTFRENVLAKSEGMVILSKEQAISYCDKYHELFPEINWWNMEVIETALKTGVIYNMLGFPLQFHEPDESDMKDVIAAGPQSTVGCITHVAFTREQEFIESGYMVRDFYKLDPEVTKALDTWGQRKRDWDLLNNSHDSYMTQCPIGEESELAKVKQFFMNQELTSPRNEKFNMKSEMQVGLNWAPAKQLPAEYANAELTPEIINKYNLVGLREISW